MDRITTTVAIALGSNLGDRRAHLQGAVDRLSTLLSAVRVSQFIESEPAGVAEPQPSYLNGVLVGDTLLPAGELLAALMAIEREHGRVRSGYRAARTLDLDLVLYGDSIIDERELQVPHPRFRERAFVLGPLKEIAPDLRDPVTGSRIADL